MLSSLGAFSQNKDIDSVGMIGFKFLNGNGQLQGFGQTPVKGSRIYIKGKAAKRLFVSGGFNWLSSEPFSKTQQENNLVLKDEYELSSRTLFLSLEFSQPVGHFRFHAGAEMHFGMNTAARRFSTQNVSNLGTDIYLYNDFNKFRQFSYAFAPHAGITYTIANTFNLTAGYIYTYSRTIGVPFMYGPDFHPNSLQSSTFYFGLEYIIPNKRNRPK